jgi:hypothetical protein
MIVQTILINVHVKERLYMTEKNGDEIVLHTNTKFCSNPSNMFGYKTRKRVETTFA